MGPGISLHLDPTFRVRVFFVIRSLSTAKDSFLLVVARLVAGRCPAPVRDPGVKVTVHATFPRLKPRPSYF